MKYFLTNINMPPNERIEETDKSLGQAEQAKEQLKEVEKNNLLQILKDRQKRLSEDFQLRLSEDSQLSEDFQLGNKKLSRKIDRQLRNKFFKNGYFMSKEFKMAGTAGGFQDESEIPNVVKKYNLKDEEYKIVNDYESNSVLLYIKKGTESLESFKSLESYKKKMLEEMYPPQNTSG